MIAVELTGRGLFRQDKPDVLYESTATIERVVGNQHGRYLSLRRVDGAQTGFPIPVQDLDRFIEMLGLNSSRQLKGTKVQVHDYGNCLYGISSIN